jgi:pilus assembly protein CpaC
VKAAIATLACAALLLAYAGPPGGGGYRVATPATSTKVEERALADVIARPSPSSDLRITVDQSTIVEPGMKIRRVSVANGEIAEAVAVSSTEVLVNGKAPGETSLILWDSQGSRNKFEIHVVPNGSKIEAVGRELRQELGDQDVSVTLEDGNVFLRGTVRDVTTADRAYTIASTLGKVVNLLRVLVPPRDSQILLKVRFANVDRSATTQLGINIFSLNQKGIASSTTGQFGQPPKFDFTQTPAKFTVTDLLNIFYYRPDLNIGAIIQDLEAKQVLQILAEPNLLTVSGRPASFLAGGEFPFPTLQGGGAGVGQVTIQFKEFGIRLNFLPTVTPRGTIRLIVTPEVSSLDYANGLTVSGFTIPGLATRRVQTEIELQNGQSFVIAGLLDNQLTEAFNRIPGFANIPILGKLFQSRSLTKSNTELFVMVTPELVAPVPEGVKAAEVKMPHPFMQGTAAAAPQQPGPNVTGPVPPLSTVDSLPIEELKSLTQPDSSNGNSPNNSTPFGPVQPVLTAQPAPPSPPPPPPAAAPRAAIPK